MLAVVTLGVKTPVIAAAVCTVTAGAVTVPVVTVAALFASLPLAVALRVSVPAAAEEHPVYEKVAVAPPAIAWAAGVAPVQVAMAVGVTAFACAVPLFVTFRAAVNTCPVLAVVTLGVKTPVMAAAVCTVTAGAVTVPVVTVAPLFASVPLAVVVRVNVPAVVVEHPVYEKVAVAPPAIAWAAGVAPVQFGMAVGVTAFACTVPLFVTFRLAVNT